MANDETGNPPFPFDITPFSLTPTMTSGPQKQDEIPSSHLEQHLIALMVGDKNNAVTKQKVFINN